MNEYGIINLILTGASEHSAFNWRFVMEHAVNLIILLGVLVYFLKTPVKNFLVERRGTISHEIDTAQKIIGEAKSKYDEYARKLQAIESEINNLKDTLRKQGESERAELLEAGRYGFGNHKKGSPGDDSAPDRARQARNTERRREPRSRERGSADKTEPGRFG